MKEKEHRSKRAVILAMIALSAVVVIFSYFYYGGKNKQADPRILPAREMYAEYNNLTAQNNFDQTYSLLKKIDEVYFGVKHYASSFERGVLFNNKAAAIITIAMVKDSTARNKIPPEFRDISKDSLINIAEKTVQNSINMYRAWFNKYENKTEDEITRMIESEFLVGLSNYSIEEQRDYLVNRIEEISTALSEKNRRMSVSLTNLGMVYRHQMKYELAVKSYKEAVDLWSENLTAKNNMNALLGRPMEKNSPLRKIFPKDKNADL